MLQSGLSKQKLKRKILSTAILTFCGYLPIYILETYKFKQEVLHMCAQELVALFRFSGNKCAACQRIVSRYERTLNLTDEDMEHLEQCILSKS